jgi:hypothetical protein
VAHLFGPDFIKRQLVAAERAGSNGFLFWNPAMRNGVVYAGLRRFGHKQLDAYGSDTEIWKKHRPGAWCKRKGDVFSKPKRRNRRRKR